MKSAASERRDCASTSPHEAHEWMWDGGRMWCEGKPSAATVSRRFKVVVCGDCKCQVRMLPDEGWQCSCCGVISEDDAHEIVVTAAVPLALIEAATS